LLGWSLDPRSRGIVHTVKVWVHAP